MRWITFIRSFIHPFVHRATDSPLSIHISILPPHIHQTTAYPTFISHPPKPHTTAPTCIHTSINSHTNPRTYLFFTSSIHMGVRVITWQFTYTHMHPYKPNPLDVSASVVDICSRCTGPGYVSQNSRCQVLAFCKGYNTFFSKYSYFIIVTFKWFKRNGLIHTPVCQDVGLFKQ